MSTKMSCHFIHLLQVSKKCLWNPIFYTFFHDLIHVYSPRTESDSLQGTEFWCQQKGLITLNICCKFQRNLFEVWIYTFLFHDFIHVYSSIPPSYPMEAPYGIWLQSAQCFQRRRCLKMLITHIHTYERTTEAFISYKLTNEPSAQVS